MAIPVLRDALPLWVELVQQEEKSGQIPLHALLQAVANEVGMLGTLTHVYHLGGLDYSFSSTESPAKTLERLYEARRPVVWGLLHAIALLGAKYPDSEASTPKTAPVT